MECEATLRVVTEQPEVDFITEALGVEPTHTHLKDAPISTFTPDRKRRSSVWLRECPLDRSRKLEHHIEWIVEILEAHASGIDALARRGCTVDIICCVTSESGQAGTVLTASLLRRLANQRIDLVIDLYPPEADRDRSTSIHG
jgi:hypothetical protein